MTTNTRFAAAEELGALGDERFRQGRLGEAIRFYRRAIEREPESAWYYQCLASATARKGWLMMARAFYRRALELDPGAVERWFEERPGRYETETSIESPVFVVGCPHSGTTITTRLIGNHPAIALTEARETNVFARAPEEVDGTLALWDRDCLAAGKTRWVEKSVIHTFMLPNLQAARPGARFVLVVRDCRDVVASLKTRAYTFTGLDDLIRTWTTMNGVFLRFAKETGTPIFRYEDLVADPEATLAGICRQAGEEFVPEMLAYHTEHLDWNGEPPRGVAGKLGDRASHNRLRAWQVNQPLFDGRGRWRAELNAEERTRIKELAQEQLATFGYVEDDRW